jgi:hypothetical protein
MKIIARTIVSTVSRTLANAGECVAAFDPLMDFSDLVFIGQKTGINKQVTKSVF